MHPTNVEVCHTRSNFVRTDESTYVSPSPAANFVEPGGVAF